MAKVTYHTKDGEFKADTHNILASVYLHREDGPALIWANQPATWWANDHCYSFDTWCKELNKTPEEKLLLQLEWF